MDVSSLLEQKSDVSVEILPATRRLHIVGSGSQFQEFFSILNKGVPVNEDALSYALITAVVAENASLVTLSSRSTDLGVSSEVSTFNVLVGGSVVFPIHKTMQVLDIAKKAPEVTMTVSDSNMHIIAGRAKWTIALPTFAVDESVYRVDVPEELVDVDAEELFTALRRSVAATSKNASRLSLAQVFFKDGKALATDGSRLHVSEVSNISNTLDGVKLPLPFVNEAIKLLRTCGEDIAKILFTDKELYLRVGRKVLSSTPLYIKFPDISGLLHAATVSATETITVTNSALQEAINSVRVTANQDYYPVSLTVKSAPVSPQGVQQWELVAHSKVLRGHQGEYSIKAMYFDGVPQGRTIVVNYQHMLKALSLIDYDEFVHIHVSGDDKKPIVVQADGFTAVIPQMKMTL